MTHLQLAKRAQQAKEFAYSPYYNFRVGAALLTTGGKVFTGCNIENAAGFSICAERVAAAKAISEGEKSFSAVAIASDAESFISPCGVCRQFLMEFSPEMTVVLFNGKDTQAFTLRDLLPHSFDLN